jgi:trehalose 6-phosphate phosphatase
MRTKTTLPEPASAWALFLDVDGTLIEIADHPDAVRVEPRVLTILTSLHHTLGGAIALVSGRPIATLDRLFAPLRLAAAGLHGLERRDAAGDRHCTAVRGPAVEDAAAALAAFARSHPGALVEDKGLTVALHVRGVPAAANAAKRLGVQLARRYAGQIEVQQGKMVIELRPPGPDKGAVVGAFLTEPPFAGRVPVFVGDDVTDEGGFAETNRRGGHSVRVGAAGRTEAHWCAATVPTLLDWLERLAASISVSAKACDGSR